MTEHTLAFERRTQFPQVGTGVTLRRWREGNTVNGSQSGLEWTISGQVTESPASGSSFITIVPVTSEPALPEQTLWDRHQPEAWTISRSRVSLGRSEFTSWTVEPWAPPQPPQTVPMTLQFERMPERAFRGVSQEWISADMPDGQTVSLSVQAGLGGTQLYIYRSGEPAYRVSVANLFEQFVNHMGWDAVPSQKEV